VSARTASGIILSINALLLANIIYVWRFAYFWLDDFNNLYWVQRETGWSMLWHNINPASIFYRPFGMLVYWLSLHIFQLHATLYHALAWGVHITNVILVYFLLSRIVESRFGAAAGTLLFAFRANFADIYWSFGFIFELLAAMLMFAVLMIHSRERWSYRNIVAILVLTTFAVKSKEMAITLPAVLLLYDICHRRRFDRRMMVELLGLTLIAVWFTKLTISTSGATAADQPYYMDLKVLTFGRGYGWYFDRLYETRLRWGAWMIISTILFLWMLYKRETRGIFFLGYTFLALLPVIFLVNHRGQFYWYIPFFGVAGLVAVGTDAIARRVERWTPTAAPTIAAIAFALLASWHYFRESAAAESALSYQRSTSAESAAFIHQLQQLPPPNTSETIYYRGFPPNFNSITLESATQVALRRTDVGVKVVEVFPDPCNYCLEFENGVLKRR
jgi:hypothetical protein